MRRERDRDRELRGGEEVREAEAAVETGEACLLLLLLHLPSTPPSLLPGSLSPGHLLPKCHSQGHGHRERGRQWKERKANANTPLPPAHHLHFLQALPAPSRPNRWWCLCLMHVSVKKVRRIKYVKGLNRSTLEREYIKSIYEQKETYKERERKRRNRE